MIEIEKDGEKVKSIVQEDAVSSFNIVNSDMGDASFFNVDFASFDTLVMKNSRVCDIKTTNKHLPVSREKKIYTDDEHKQNSQYLEEFYNQLYLAMQKEGNRTWEIKYYIEYLEWHRINKLLNLTKHNIFNALFKQDWHTPVSLWLHKQTSSYGTNWIRPFLLILFFGFIFYFGYVLTLPEIKWGFHYFNIENFSFHFRYYIEFLLPTHKFELISGTHPVGLSALLDIISRISIGFLIYQTIVAFRRFGRK
ncbi:hypothetical protein ES705_40851 [subsurface metagenome]